MRQVGLPSLGLNTTSKTTIERNSWNDRYKPCRRRLFGEYDWSGTSESGEAASKAIPDRPGKK